MSPNRIQNIAFGKTVIDYDPPRIEIGGFAFTRETLPEYIFAPNGAGKTSFVHALSGSIPSAISANLEMSLLLQTDVRDYTLPEARQLFRIIPQDWRHGFLGFTPDDEMLLASTVDNQWSVHVRDVLDFAGLRDVRTSSLSDGERKRFMVGLALIDNPAMVISDEWAIHLDEDWRAEIFRLFEEYVEHGGMHLSLTSASCVQRANAGASIKFGKIDSSASIAPAHEGLAMTLTNLLAELRMGIQEIGIPANALDAEVTTFPAKKRVRLTASPGQILEIVGNNGSGKTTLIRNLWLQSRSSTMCRQLTGRAYVPPVFFVTADPYNQLRGPSLEDELIQTMGRPFITRAKTIALLISRVLGIDSETDVLALSFAQRKMLAITCSILSRAPIIALDEPFAGLDECNSNCLRSILESAAESGKTLLIAGQNQLFPSTVCIHLTRPL